MTRRHGSPHSSRLVAYVAAAALVGGVATGCSGSAGGSVTPNTPTSGTTTSAHTDPPTTKAPPKPAKAPATGTCRRLDYSAISRYSNGDPAVPCSSPHTAYTFAVKRIPADVSVPGVSIGNKSIQDAASTSCRDAFAGFIGGTPSVRSLSRLSVTYFLPEQRDFNLGAHWVRCDVVALKTFNQLAALPTKLQGLLDHAGALKSYGLCATGAPGAASSRLVMCAEKHQYRAEAALRLGSANAPYPGPAAVGPDGQRQCMTYLEHLLGTSGGFTYGWTYPTSTDWSAGQRFGYCYLKSAR
jgi:Septum formation